MGIVKAFINSSFKEISKVLLQIWLYTKTTTSIEKINITTCPFGLGLLRVCVLSFTFPFFFFFSKIWIVTALFMHMDSLYRRQSALFTGPTTTLFRKKILKMNRMTLFTHLKIILLQCFQFSVFSKICCIRMDPTYFENLTIVFMFFIFLTHMSNFVIIRYYLLCKQLIDGLIIDLLQSLQAWRI